MEKSLREKYNENKNNHIFYTVLVRFPGCIILLASIFIIVNNNIIKKIATCLLWVYSIAFAIIGTLGNLVASPKPMLALVSTVIMIVNIALLIVNYFLVLNENQH